MMVVVVRQSMCEEYVRTFFRHRSVITLTEDESIKAVKCRDRVYELEFERFSDARFFTNTHGMVVVVRQNACGVPVWT
jgi:hypothetical protein